MQGKGADEHTAWHAQAAARPGVLHAVTIAHRREKARVSAQDWGLCSGVAESFHCVLLLLLFKADYQWAQNGSCGK